MSTLAEVGVRLDGATEPEPSRSRRRRALSPILVDEATDPGVILESGRPDLFVIRADHGDAKWKRILAHPWGHVKYLLIGIRNAGFTYDLISDRYPTAVSGSFPGAQVLYQSSRSVLLDLSPAPPGPARAPSRASMSTLPTASAGASR